MARRSDATSADVDRVGAGRRDRKRGVVDIAARTTAATGLVAAGAAAAHHKGMDGRGIGGRREGVGVHGVAAFVVYSDAEVVNPVVAYARDIAARAGNAHAGGRECAGSLVCLDALVVDHDDLVGIGCRRGKALDLEGRRDILPEIGGVFRPDGWFHPGRRPDLRLEDARRRRRGAKRRDCRRELGMAGAEVVERHAEDRLLDDRDRLDGTGGKEGGVGHGVIVGLHPVRARHPATETHFVHLAAEVACAGTGGSGKEEAVVAVGRGCVGGRCPNIGGSVHIEGQALAIVNGIELVPVAVGGLGVRNDGGVNRKAFHFLVRRLGGPKTELVVMAFLVAGILIVVLNRPGAIGVGNFSTDEIRALGIRLSCRILLRLDPERNGKGVSVRGRVEVVHGGSLGRFRQRHFDALGVFRGPGFGRDARPTDAAVRLRERAGRDRCAKAVRRSIFEQNAGVCGIVHVPDAGVVAPGIARADRGRAARDGVVPHDELGAVRDAREGHPDQRLAGSVPRVDFVWNAVCLHVDEAEVGSVRVVEVGIEKALNAFSCAGVVFLKPYEDGEVGEDFRSRVVRDGELDAASELGDRWIRARQGQLTVCPGGQCKRGECQRKSACHKFFNVHD